MFSNQELYLTPSSVYEQKKHQFLNENRVLTKYIELFPWNVIYWRSMESISKLKINGQTFEYEIKVQVLKDTSWIRLRYLARFSCPRSSKQHSCCYMIEGFCFAQLFKKRSGISYSWVNEKWIVQKMNLLLQLYITEIEQCLLI